MDRFKNIILKNETVNEMNDGIKSIIFEIILRQIKDLIYVMKVEEDQTFRYVFINEVAKAHANLESDCIGKSFYDVLPVETADHLHKQYTSVIQKRLPISFQDAIELGNEQVVYGESILSPIFDDVGNIRYIVSVTRDITDSIAEKNMITFMAYHDHLTGLPNRSSLKEELDLSVEQAKEKNETFALMYLDMDRFKLLNDSMDHLAGDQLLKEVADRLSAIKRKGYRVFRQGGDEFIVLLLQTSTDEAKKCAMELVHVMNQPFVIQDEEFFISASIGISMYPNDGQDGETLIKNADTALYRAKELGRSLFQFYTMEMSKKTAYLMVLETGLRRAVERNELELYYQPQFDLISGEVNSFEALLRWNHPTLGIVSPGEFIPLAEESGLIIPIGEWVIKTVCRKLKEWNERGYRQVSIGINLSAKQFQQVGLVDMIQDVIRMNQIDAHLIEFELTEGAMQDAQKALITLNRLKEVGVRISVDDFGTGYSSLSYLKRFPIDSLKIDQSFVKDVLNDEKDAAITTTIIHLAQSLGLSVIAEGVESQNQAEFFRLMQCHKAQGYFFSRPLPEAGIIEHYMSNKTT